MGGTKSASTAAGVRTIAMLPDRVRCFMVERDQGHPRAASQPHIPLMLGPARRAGDLRANSLTTRRSDYADHRTNDRLHRSLMATLPPKDALKPAFQSA